MTGRMRSTPLQVIWVDVVALSVALWLGFTAAANLGGHSLLDLSGWPGRSGMELLFAVLLCMAAATYTVLSFSRRLRF